MNRRSVLVSVAAVAAGCVGTATEERDPTPDPDTPPETFLPAAGDGWTQLEQSELLAGGVRAEAGARARYGHETGEYAVELLRWSSEADATELGGEVYASGWAVFVTRGVFSFACTGPDGQVCESLLARSDALTPEYIAANQS